MNTIEATAQNVAGTVRDCAAYGPCLGVGGERFRRPAFAGERRRLSLDCLQPVGLRQFDPADAWCTSFGLRRREAARRGGASAFIRASLAAVCLGLVWVLACGSRLLGAAGDLDAAFPAVGAPDQPVYSALVQPDQKIVVGGTFSKLGTNIAGRLARLNPDGSIDGTFKSGVGCNDAVYALARQADGAILAGGRFTTYDGVARNRLVRLMPDGTRDATFQPTAEIFGDVYALLALPGGGVLVGGNFTHFGGPGVGSLVRLKSDGSRDDTFDPKVDGPVHALVRQADGGILVGGGFLKVFGQPRIRLARLESGGGLDPFFDPAGGPDGTVRGIGQLAGGDVVVVGDFFNFNGLQRLGLVRLDGDGLPVPAVDAGFNSTVAALSIVGGERMLVVGNFTALVPGNQAMPRIGLFSRDGRPDATFVPGVGPNARPVVIADEGNGNAIVGGEFSQYGASGHGYLVRIKSSQAVPAGELSFKIPEVSVSEAAASVTVEVVRQSGTAGAVTVNYASTAGTASAGDFTPVSGQLAFAAGETLKSIVVNLRQDTQLEDEETFQLTLSNPGGGAVLGMLKTALVRILDDEVPTNAGSLETAFRSQVPQPAGVYAMEVAPDGRVLVGGDFGQIGAVNRSRLARVLPGGGLDPDFSPGTWCNDAVYAIRRQADGRILVAGRFTQVNGQSRGRLARLLADGTLDPSFNSPGFGGDVYAVEIQSSGDILVGGNFSSAGGDFKYRYLVRLFDDGTLDTEFQAGATGTVHSIRNVESGNVLIGGEFLNVGGVSRPRIAKLGPDGGLVAAFDPGAGPDSTVQVVLPLPDGRVMIGGYFSQVNGLSRPFLARLHPSGLPDPSFSTELPLYVFALLADARGRLLVGGSFQPFGTPTANGGVVRLLPDGRRDPSFDLGKGVGGGTVYELGLLPDGDMLAGGVFATYNDFQRPGLVRINLVPVAPGGEMEFAAATFAAAESGGTVTIDVVRRGATNAAVTVDYTTENGTATVADFLPATGKLSFAAGENRKSFTVSLKEDTLVEDLETVGLKLLNPAGGAVLGSQRAAVLRVADNDSSTVVGAADVSFGARVNGIVYSTFEDPAGNFVIGGRFFDVNGVGRARIARVDIDGALDLSFLPGTWFNGDIYVVRRQPDGRILVGGEFTQVNGVARSRIVRLLPNGALDDSFDPKQGPNSTVLSIEVLPNTDIVVGGYFSAFAGSPDHRYCVRVFSDGSLDTSFVPSPNGAVRSIRPLTDGRMLIAGEFSQLAGRFQGRIARLNADGSNDPEFNAGAGADSTIFSMVVLSDGRIVIGGSFGRVHGANRPYLARLLKDGSVDPGFIVSPNSTVNTVARLDGDRVLIGGYFSQIGPLARARIARIREDGLVDVTFDPGKGPELNGANGVVWAVLPASDGAVLVGGDFNQYDGIPRGGFVRLNGVSAVPGGEIEFVRSRTVIDEGEPSVDIEVRRTGPSVVPVGVTFSTVPGSATADDFVGKTEVLSFAAGEKSKVVRVSLKADALVEREETFGIRLALPTGGAALGAQQDAVIAIADDDAAGSPGALDTAFRGDADGPVYAVDVGADGRILVGGEYTTVGGAVRPRLTRLLPDGTVDPGFAPGLWLDSSVFALSRQAGDGRILVGGQFGSVSGFQRRGLVRLEPDGTVDGAFNATGTAVNSTVYTVLAQADGSILVGGAFSAASSDPKYRYLIRLLSDGSLDTSFAATPNGAVYSLRADALGRVYVGGDFTVLGDVPRARFARLTATGEVDASFDPGPGPNSTVRTSVDLDPATVLVGGLFNTYSNVARPFLAGVGLNGALLPLMPLPQGPNSYVYAMVRDPDAGVVVGGSFTAFNTTTPQGYLARLAANGTLDPAFAIGTGFDSEVYALAAHAGGAVLVGGRFSKFNGTPALNFARILTKAPVGGGVRIKSAQPGSAGKLKLTLSGPVGAAAVIQRSETLKSWSPEASITLSSSEQTIEVTLDLSRRSVFFRVAP